MKIAICVFTAAFLAVSPASMAQKKTTKSRPKAKVVNTPPTPAHSVDYCMENYLFEEAETQLQRNIAALKRKKQDTAEEERMLTTAERGKRMLRGTQKVIFIDSFLVSRDRFLEKYRLGKDAGRIDTYDHFFNANENTDGMVYATELGNKCYYSRPTLSGGLSLCTSDLIGGKWTDPQPLKGMDENGVRNYPFMLNDGITLYYAAEGSESLGGYDIFVTRYNADNQQFLEPENIGMPFNSPANDYMYAIDEMNNLGWFVTDRNLLGDSVCIYVFVPSDTRAVYDYDVDDKAAIARAARICSIAETWGDNNAVQQAKQRLAAVLTTPTKAIAKPDFMFVVNDRHTYTQVADFKSSEAKKMFAWWKESRADWQKNEQQLAQMREAYARGNKSDAAQILALEKRQETLQNSIREQEKKIRNAEIQALGER